MLFAARIVRADVTSSKDSSDERISRKGAVRYLQDIQAKTLEDPANRARLRRLQLNQVPPGNIG